MWCGRRGAFLPLVMAMAGLACGCASSGTSARPRPVTTPRTAGPAVLPPGVAPPAPAAPSPSGTPVSAAARSVLDTAIALLGTPYRDGGTTIDGFDCSGFVQWVYSRHGVLLPRSVSAQYAVGTPLPAADARGGDLLFFSTTGPGATHVAIALGDGRFVHAPSSRGVVRIERVESTYWRPRLLGARRVLATDAQ